MTTILLVFLGGGIGSVLRYLVGLGAASAFGTAWPWGTFLVNVVGCFAMGIAARVLPIPDVGTSEARLLLMTGVLGGFTTFSAFALDAAGLWRAEEALGLYLYVGGSVILSLAAVAIGLAVGGALK